MTMKAITVWQPWAMLIMLGFKGLEFRPWPCPKAVRGTRVVIHAGKRKPPSGEMKSLAYDLARGHYGTVGRLEDCQPALAFVEHAMRDPSLIPLGVALGTVMLGVPQRVTALFPQFDPSELDERMWGWPVSDPQSFPRPVEIGGEQGFWNFPPDAAMQAGVNEAAAPSPLFNRREA